MAAGSVPPTAGTAAGGEMPTEVENEAGRRGFGPLRGFRVTPSLPVGAGLGVIACAVAVGLASIFAPDAPGPEELDFPYDELDTLYLTVIGLVRVGWALLLVAGVLLTVVALWGRRRVGEYSYWVFADGFVYRLRARNVVRAVAWSETRELSPVIATTEFAAGKVLRYRLVSDEGDPIGIPLKIDKVTRRDPLLDAMTAEMRRAGQPVTTYDDAAASPEALRLAARAGRRQILLGVLMVAGYIVAIHFFDRMLYLTLAAVVLIYAVLSIIFGARKVGEERGAQKVRTARVP